MSRSRAFSSSTSTGLLLRLPAFFFFLRRAPLATKSSPNPPVGIFWDLRCRPALRPLHAALRLRLLSSRLGPLRLSLAFTPRPLPSLPSAPAAASLPCPLCGRRLPDRPALLLHFHRLHRTEHAKRLRRLDSASGSRRAALAASMTAKLDKYRAAVRDLEPAPSPSDDLTGAGMRVVVVPDAGEVGDRLVEAVAAGAVGCVVLASEDAGLEAAVREARARGAKAVVVGEGGALRRCADVGFSWKEVAGGRASDLAEAALRRWREGELLGRLEWAYQPGEEEEDEEEEEKGEEEVQGGSGSALGKVVEPRAWWELDSDPPSSGSMN